MDTFLSVDWLKKTNLITTSLSNFPYISGRISRIIFDQSALDPGIIERKCHAQDPDHVNVMMTEEIEDPDLEIGNDTKEENEEVRLQVLRTVRSISTRKC